MSGCRPLYPSQKDGAHPHAGNPDSRKPSQIPAVVMTGARRGLCLADPPES